jgi:hypothetical protein
VQLTCIVVLGGGLFATPLGAQYENKILLYHIFIAIIVFGRLSAIS